MMIPTPRFTYIGDATRVTKCRYMDDRCIRIDGCPGEIDGNCVFYTGAGEPPTIDNKYIHLFIDNEYPFLPIIPLDDATAKKYGWS